MDRRQQQQVIDSLQATVAFLSKEYVICEKAGLGPMVLEEIASAIEAIYRSIAVMQDRM